MEKKEIIDGLIKLILPSDFIENFNIEKIEEHKNNWEIILFEKEELIPKELDGKVAVKDGYCNPIELQSFPIKGKAFYIKLYRRRWKAQGTQNSYENSYDLHLEGMKATKEFGAFLKGSFGLTATEFSERRHNLMH
jgi:hypothetical protein